MWLVLSVSTQFTIMSAQYYHENLEKKYPLVGKPQPCMGVDRMTLFYTLGWIHVPFRFLHKVFLVKVRIMENTSATILLGDDILRAFDITCAHGRNTIWMGNQVLPSYNSTTNPFASPNQTAFPTAPFRVAHAQLAFEQRIPSLTTQFTRFVAPMHARTGDEVLVQPHPDLRSATGVILPRVVTTVRDQSVVIPITNPTEEDIILSTGAPLLSMEPFLACTMVVPGLEDFDDLDEDIYDTEALPTTSDSRREDAKWRAKKEATRRGEVQAFIKELHRNMELGASQVPQQGLDVDSAEITEGQRPLLAALLAEYDDVFVQKGAPQTATDVVQHRIVTTTDKPIRQRMHRNPIHQRAEAARLLQEMLDKGVVRPSNSPWASPVVLAKKKDGTIRFCMDYRRLNSVTRKDSFPLPRIDETLAALAGAKYFTTVDLQAGYWQIPMHPDDIEKTAFVTNEGLFESTVMPFGLANAPATFQRLMQFVLAGLLMEHCLCYIDDVIVFSSSFEEHLFDLDRVLDRFRKANLKLKPTKCELARKSVHFLGHVVSADGISPDPEKIRTIVEMAMPTSVTILRRTLGMMGYYRPFIAQFGVIAAPLYDLTQKVPRDVTFASRFLPIHREAIEALQKALATSPVLAYPDFTKPFILYTDASNLGIGYVLVQKGDDGVERPIHYGSKKFSPAEKNYAISEKECLAVVRGLTQLRQYLLGGITTVYTDHAALRQILDKDRHAELATPRLLRFAMMVIAF